MIKRHIGFPSIPTRELAIVSHTNSLVKSTNLDYRRTKTQMRLRRSFVLLATGRRSSSPPIRVAANLLRQRESQGQNLISLFLTRPTKQSASTPSPLL